MNSEVRQEGMLDPSEVRDQLDEILAQEITALLDVDETTAMMSFNLASIACVTLIIEREREIKQYADFPPERYTKESFINELVDIGLEKDEEMLGTVRTVLDKGYISSDNDGQLKAEMPSFMMAGFLDNMFPGMQGMNLIAFVLQMNDEVNSGRKNMELAKESFKSTLKSRGVSVTKDKAEEKATEFVSGVVATSSQSKGVSQKLKKDNLNRLSRLIKTRRKKSQDAQRVQVKDVFDKGPSKEELEAQKAEIRAAEEAARKAADLARQLAEKDEKIKEAEEAAKEAARQLEEIEKREKELEAAREKAEKADEMAAQLAEKEAMMAEKEARLKALEEKLKQEEENRLQREEEARLKKEAAEKPTEDNDIESRIAEFESELAMPCPLCHDGKVVSNTTDKGKEFFSCTSEDCRFVSWDKPYHFECPLCKNSFLTETEIAPGQKGLKCPRAACSYTQDNLFDPKQNMAQAAAGSSTPRRKNALSGERKKGNEARFYR